MELARYGQPFSFRIPMPIFGEGNLAAAADWTPQTGEVKLSRDGQAVVDIEQLPTAVPGAGSLLWDFQLSATEMEAAEIVVQIRADGLADQVYRLLTFGHPSAALGFDLAEQTPTAELASGSIAAVVAGLADQWATDPAVDGYSIVDTLRVIAATTAGLLSGSQTDEEVFYGLDGVTPRVTVTTDIAGNRLAVTYH